MPDPWYIEEDVPMEGERKNQSYFCETCRELLDEYEQGYLLIDMHDLQNPVVYDLEDGVVYEMRCYLVHMIANWVKGGFQLRVDGIN